MYKVIPGSDGNIVPLRVLKILFLKSAIAEIHTRNNNTIMLKVYNQ